MKKRELEELRSQSLESLEKRLGELKKKMLEVQVKIAAGQEKNVKKLKNLRCDVAQVKTIIKEKEGEKK